METSSRLTVSAEAISVGSGGRSDASGAEESSSFRNVLTSESCPSQKRAGSKARTSFRTASSLSGSASRSAESFSAAAAESRREAQGVREAETSAGRASASGNAIGSARSFSQRLTAAFSSRIRRARAAKARWVKLSSADGYAAFSSAAASASRQRWRQSCSAGCAKHPPITLSSRSRCSVSSFN